MQRLRYDIKGGEDGPWQLIGSSYRLSLRKTQSYFVHLLILPSI